MKSYILFRLHYTNENGVNLIHSYIVNHSKFIETSFNIIYQKDHATDYKCNFFSVMFGHTLQSLG